MSAVEQIGRHVVYGVTDSRGDALYVGCTNDLDRRTAEHRRYSPWWAFAKQVEVLASSDDRAKAFRLESAITKIAKPIYNQVNGTAPLAVEAIALAVQGISIHEYRAGVSK